MSPMAVAGSFLSRLRSKRSASPLQRLALTLLLTAASLLVGAGLFAVSHGAGLLFPLLGALTSSWLLGRGAGLLSAVIGAAAVLGAPMELAGWAQDAGARAVGALTFGVVAVVGALLVAPAAASVRGSAVDEAQTAREAKCRELVEHCHAGIVQLTPDARIAFANRSLAELLQTEVEELQGRPIREHLTDDEAAQLHVRQQRRRDGVRETYDASFIRADGQAVWVSVAESPVNSPDGAFLGSVATVTDITERKQRESALREAEARFAAFMENMPAVLVIRAEDGTYVAASRSYEESFGKAPAELIGKTPYDVFPAEVARQLLAHEQEVFRDGVNRRFTQFVPGSDGKTRELLTDKFLLVDEGGRRYVGSIAVDVTAQRALEDQLRQSQKMEAVGRLAGGVAHDFNNMLAVIMGYSEVLSWRSDLSDDAKNLVREVHNAGARAAALTRQLLAFGRQQILAPRVLDLGETVVTASSMLRRLIGEDVELAVVTATEPSLVKADPSQVEQILLNLVVNSRDALPTGGKVTVEVQNVEVDDVFAAQHPDMKVGSYVLLAVTDTGVGMDAATQERIFEPFFTTKEQGKGTGLGLATVFGIVKQSNGSIGVYSEMGHGATFKVYLPREATGEAGEAPDDGALQLPFGAETVLLVEDEEIVRRLARDILLQAGYTVLEAANGSDALRVIQEHSGPVHLVVTDVVMPEMSGRELVRRLCEARPGIRVLLMSGYTDDAVVRHGILSSETEFLQKPFTASGFTRKVRDVLDRS